MRGEADIEGEDVDVVCGAPALAISGFESHGFIFSEIFRRKGLKGHTFAERVVDTAQSPECEFSNLQKIPLTFLLEFFAGQSLISIRLVVLRAPKLKMTS